MAKVMRVESGIDRISTLPHELLSHILSFVPTKVAVCTSVLSTRWRHLYTLVSSLDFVTDIDSDAHDIAKAIQFMNFVERVLLFRTIAPVERFRLKFHYHIDPSRFDGWIRALVLRNIQELDLCNVRNTVSCPLPLPATLFSCETLVAFRWEDTGFHRNDLKIPAKVCLPNLKVLHIGKAALSCCGVERLLSSCPVLDDLVLDCCRFVIDVTSLQFCISSAKLERLTITRSNFSAQRHSPQIVINCPALVYLNILLCKEYYVHLVAAESLAKVVIDAIPLFPPDYDNAYGVLQEMKNTRSLQIHDCIIQGLFIRNLPLPLFNKLTYLKLCDRFCLFDSHCLEYLLTQCVVLETLVFEQQDAKERLTDQSPMIQNTFQHSQLIGLLCHLKTIEIQLFYVTHHEACAIVEIIGFFLTRAKVLEKVSVRVRQFPDTQQLMITKAFLTLPRASTKCLVFVDNW